MKIVGIQFRGAGKVYSFDARDLELPVGTGVIVDSAQGIAYGLVVAPAREESEETAPSTLKPVLRIATEDDLKKVRDNTAKEQEAYRICLRKIADHKLDMKLVEAEYALDGSKILFYFTSDDRVDFRELVKDLGSTFHTRIELRQIGVRDEARTLGGLGICGRPFCCSTFLADFQPVSIKMAKEQGLSLNPTKISGTCGRLMCCLKYEQEAYEDLIRRTAPVGSYVQTPEGNGFVTDYYLLTGVLKVKMEDSADTSVRCFKNDAVTVLRRPERGKGKKPGGNGNANANGAPKQDKADAPRPQKSAPAQQRKERPAPAPAAGETAPAAPKIVVNALLFDDTPKESIAPKESGESRGNNGNGGNGGRRRSRSRGGRGRGRQGGGDNASKPTANVGGDGKD